MEDITWAQCTLRTWLNNDFISTAFTAEEQEAILLTDVDNSASQCFDFTTVSAFALDTIGGKNTQDKIFLLSYAEANKYLGVTPENSDNMEARTSPTGYAIAQGVRTSTDNRTVEGAESSLWWLRSPGLAQSSAACVSSSGKLYNDFTSVDHIGYSVRPAFWLSAEFSGMAVLADSSDADEESFDATTQLEAAKAACQPGNYVTLGTYRQGENGEVEPIEWLVLDVQDGKALLISRYGLDAKPYNKKYYTDTTWEQCTLRDWLNSDFISTAFTAEEQETILLTDVDNSASQCFDFTTVEQNYVEKTTGGNDTQDKIFLLSYAEANKYLGVTWENTRNKESRISPTTYAIGQGAESHYSDMTWEGDKSVRWWLRSPGCKQSGVAVVSSNGSLSYETDTYSTDICIRPAFWLDLESSAF